MSVELGPGLLQSIFDGIQRPLDVIKATTGDFVRRGASVPALDRSRRWHFVPSLAAGARVSAGDILGTVSETSLVEVRIPVPPGVAGELTSIRGGDFTVTEPVATVRTDAGERELSLMQRWPVRRPRPVRERLAPAAPLNTGQRIIDSLFPIAKGGTACVPGPFGSGKTVVQHQLAKWADAKVIVYIGCGERGNEMTDVLREFPHLLDPASGEPLMLRTVLIANTSNMPVAAREASIYTGITIAEYFRDMGYDVALMADSTSRWAEALREISGRQEEMPGEEGYPAYLATRVAEFYERAGRVRVLGGDGSREGTLTAIGAVSPPGGDFSDPVVQATLKVVKVFWGLDDKLAFRRHFPAINWLTSYSLYDENLRRHFEMSVSGQWPAMRRRVMALLQREADLLEIARLVGKDSLSHPDQLLLETARTVREDFLHQNAFSPTDQYTSLAKQFRMLRALLELHDASAAALERGAPLEAILALPERGGLSGVKDLPEDRLDRIDAASAAAVAALARLQAGGAAPPARVAP
jgi:V/A-type H+-transporting ATPase subunit A